MTFNAYKPPQKCGFDLKPFAAIEKRVLEAKARKQQSIVKPYYCYRWPR
jgi:hypothetical protein